MLKIPSTNTLTAFADLNLAEASAPPQRMDENAAADKIAQFFRKGIAAEVYSNMFAKGEAYEELDYTPSKQPKHPESLGALKYISGHNLENIRNDVTPLSSEERSLVAAIVNSPWNFRHQTNGPVVNDSGAVNILSSQQLHQKNITTQSGTSIQDRKILANDDFVFFGVEFTDQSKLGKLHSQTHGETFYGHDAYILPETDPRTRYGYLTLTDHLMGYIEDYSHVELERKKWPPEHQGMIDAVKDDIKTQDLTDLITDHSQMFSTKDMKLGLALHAVQFLRYTTSEQDPGAMQFRKWVLSEAKENSVELHRALNLIFQPEFHLPRIWSSNQYTHIGVGNAKPQVLLEARNFKKLDQMPLSVDQCARFLLNAIRRGYDDISQYLLNRPELTLIEHQADAMGLSDSGKKSIAGALALARSPSPALLNLLSEKGLLPQK